MSIHRRLFAAAGAASALALLLAGPPVLLLATIGDPLPDWTTLSSASALDDTTVLRLLACLAWLAWAQFTAGTLVEAVAALRGRPLPRRIAIGQGLARALITVIATSTVLAPVATAIQAHAIPAATAPAPAAQTIVESTPTARAAPVSSADLAVPGWVGGHQPMHASAASPIYLVGSDSSIAPTLWSIADRTLGNPLRWREIWQLNQDRTMNDGRTFTNPDDIHTGWVLYLPDDAHSVPGATGSASSPGLHIDVTTPGETLSGIADREYGNPNDYPVIAAANQGRTEPDGRIFTDPNKIWPGWPLVIPPRPDTTGTNGHAPPPTPSQPPQPAPPDPTRPTAPTRPTPETTPTTPESTSQPSAPSTDSGAPSGAPAPHPSAPGTDQPGESQPTGSTRDATARHSTVDLPRLIGGSTLLAALIATAVARRRRRQLRHRRPGRMIATGAPPQHITERALAVSGSAGAPDVSFLHDALRSMVDTLARQPNAQLPDVLAAKLRSDRLELRLSRPAGQPPAPWTRSDSDRRWQLHRDDLRPLAADRVAYHFAPYPTLATLATTAEGEAWLVDLEHLGCIAVTGPPAQRRGLLRYVAAELAHNSWSEQLHVTLVGVGQEMTALDPARVTYTDDLSAVLSVVRAQLEDSRAEAEAGADVLGARLRNDADVAAPHVIVIDAVSADTEPDQAGAAAAQEILAELAELTYGDTRTAIAVLIASDKPVPQARWQVHIDANAALTIPFLESTEPLTACQILPDEAADLAALLSLVADTADRPMPAARGSAPWDRYADAAGGPRPELIAARSSAAPAPTARPEAESSTKVEAVSQTVSGRAEAEPASVLPLADEVYLNHSATTPADLDLLAPAVPGRTRTLVSAADPDLDTDLAAWNAAEETVPRLRLLGSPAVSGVGDPPAGRGALLTEIVAYLSTRPHGVTVEQIATDLWPHIPDAAAKTTPRQSVSMARQWLGISPRTGRERLPRAVPDAAGAKLYRVHDVLVDADLFRRLRLRGTSRGPAGIADLRAALSLVVGTPFAQRRPGGYSWLADTPLDHEYTAMIIDTAHVVATHDLAAGNPAAATAAAHVALRAVPDGDVALLDLIAAADAQGNHAEAQSYLRRLLAGHDADVEEDLPPRTYQVLLRLTRGFEGSWDKNSGTGRR